MAKKERQNFPREPIGSLAQEMKALGKEELQELLRDYLPALKTTSQVHQLASLAIGVTEEQFLFALDMGAGKSKIAIDIFSVRRMLGEGKRALVTCPPIVCNHWAQEVKKHASWSVAVVEGTPNEKYAIFTEAKTDFIIVSQPWLTRLFTDAEAGKVQKSQIVQSIQRFDFLFIDEVHRLKTASSKGFAGYAEFFANIQFRYFLTGTPVGNDYLGLWAIFYLLDGGKTFGESYNKFLSTWFDIFLLTKENKKTGKVFTVPLYTLNKKRKTQFFERFWTKTVRWEESELADLPEKTYMVIPLGLTATQRKEYALAIKKHTIDDDSPIWDLMRITGGATEELRTSRQISTKLEALEGIIEHICIEREEQLVIWVYLVDEARAVAEFITKKFKLRFGEVRAEITKTQKDKALRDWKNGTNRIILANQGSLGIGVDLYEASTDVFYSNSRSLIERKQSEKRIHRTGQTKPCLHIDLVCDNTVDQIILDGLNRAAEGFAALSLDQVWGKIQKTFTVH
jgi:SNF2 family DNA or RNA helicase